MVQRLADFLGQPDAGRVPWIELERELALVWKLSGDRTSSIWRAPAGARGHGFGLGPRSGAAAAAAAAGGECRQARHRDVPWGGTIQVEARRRGDLVVADGHQSERWRIHAARYRLSGWIL